MDNDQRFSVLKLENDVLEYVSYKEKYLHYQEKSNKSCFRSEHYKKKKDFWYKKYIYKMSYLEKNYRSIHNYTDYHIN